MWQAFPRGVTDGQSCSATSGSATAHTTSTYSFSLDKDAAGRVREVQFSGGGTASAASSVDRSFSSGFGGVSFGASFEITGIGGSYEITGSAAGNGFVDGSGTTVSIHDLTTLRTIDCTSTLIPTPGNCASGSSINLRGSLPPGRYSLDIGARADAAASLPTGRANASSSMQFDLLIKLIQQ
jgi:hypothetical protein